VRFDGTSLLVGEIFVDNADAMSSSVLLDILAFDLDRRDRSIAAVKRGHQVLDPDL
jgi:hypothetical protein